MDIAITGSSGLIGTRLRQDLAAAGHRPIRVVRRAPAAGADEIRWDPAAGEIDAASFEGLDAVIHLAGAGIGDEKWTDERKKLVLDSRTESTSLLAATLATLTTPPKRFLSGSAIGWYGDRGNEVLTESSERGSGYLADVCVAWENEAAPAVDAGISTAFLRTGLVQSADGGSLAKSLLPFKLGIGGKFGSGEQYWSWITIDDQVGAIMHLLDSGLTGPVNLTAPEPVTNAVYTKALGSVLNRPTLIPIPMIGPKLLLGAEAAEALIMTSARVRPSALEADGYTFAHREIEAGLRAVLGR